MKRRYDKFNPKRRFRSLAADDLMVLEGLAKKVRYGGNPEHKKNPGDFGLTPPSDPRVGKSLCDDVSVTSRAEALKLLKEGLKKGLVSDRHKGDWPQNVWSVTKEGRALEAQLENSELGSYHGYPMPESDPFADCVLAKWKGGNV